MKYYIFTLIFIATLGLSSCNGVAKEEQNLVTANNTVKNEEVSSEEEVKIAETPTTEEENTVLEDDMLEGETLIAKTQESELSEIEINSLLVMREEEKLARDVYTKLHELWGKNIFYNIAQSEQTHTNAVKTLLERYEIEDPMSTDTQGVFENEDLQALYDSLIEQGSKSLLDALLVGATVEDLDIKDLQNFSAVVDNEDILTVYANLERGSRNHLRSFTKNIVAEGGTYTAQYISQEEYESIIASEQERGGGNGMGHGGGKWK